MAFDAFDSAAMLRALKLAERGEGRVEPNPMVGAVIATLDPDGHRKIVAEGWHAEYGGDHAEVMALASAGTFARGATLYATLEPCCHRGKTAPCTVAIIAAGIARVVVATQDPFESVNGSGIAALRAAGITVEQGLHADEARRLTAPFQKLMLNKKPWLIAKWAMSLDGCMATGQPDNRWISSVESRGIVHALRGRIDAIAVGIGTVLADDPDLTARPPGLRQPLRIILDSNARLPLTSRLVESAQRIPLLIATGPLAPADRLQRLRDAGCEIWIGNDPSPAARLESLLLELGARQLTNLLVEGGPTLLGSLFHSADIDEIWAFVAPKIIGDQLAPASTFFGPHVPPIHIEHVSHPGGDIFIRGTVIAPQRN
ncbi:MAG: bifunctional diaminohydroxyphosphoribosylaminopyrimidine deaminase/5-amino-6-(5-phosphoribosylamino)uracil reductase RibD [Planctomycetota bacterium]